MATKAINFRFNGPTTGISTYDSTVTNLGGLIKQYSGATNADIFAGPAIIGLARPVEASTSIPGIYPHVITYDDTTDWVFLADNATAAATRRILVYEYNKNSSTFNWKGFITATFPTATVHTIRGFRVSLEKYTTGTVSVNGTTVTGTGSTWSNDRMSAGSRIGFGSTASTQITTWYEISTVDSNTQITLTSNAGISGATNYVIEDFRLVISTTNATATNGGLFLCKGLRYENFSPAGTTIPSAVLTDNIRACYWLADAATVTNTTAAGVALEERVSWTSQNVYVLNVTGAKVFKYNIRAALTLSSGKDTTALVLSTGNQTLTGTLSQANNGRIGVLNHGPGSGITSLYFATTTRVYRSDLTVIVSASTTWTSDVMSEIPPGGTSTYPATASLSSVEIANDIDRLVIATTGSAGARSYVSQYNTVGNPFDHIFLVDDKQYDQSPADSGGVAHPSIGAAIMSIWSQNGILYLARVATTLVQNQLYTLPIGAHQTYAITNNQMLITPAFDTSDVYRFYNVTFNYISKLGADTFSMPTEPFKKYYRTIGISDNTGEWTQLDDYGDLSAVSPTSQIQFMCIFKILGTTCIPSRIMGVTVAYEDNTTDSHYEPSIANSSVTNRIFAYRQKTSWGSNIPNMRIRLYNVSSGLNVLDDNVSSSSFGTFEYSSDNGSNWLAWSSTADTVGNYIRYTATSLPAGTRIRALLTQA